MTPLEGREELIREVSRELDEGHSVLLYGPEGVGKSAIVSVTAREDAITIDPLERVSRQQAARIRRALDSGAVYLAAARSSDRRDLGAVGRILWRFRLLRVRELSTIQLARVVARELAGHDTPLDTHERAWAHQAAQLSGGRPGFAAAMAQFARAWRLEHGYLPLPGMAFAASREDAVIRTLSRPSPNTR